MKSGFEEQWRQRFVERGRQFDDDAGIAGWSDSGLEARLRNFRRVWPGSTPGELWLDAGCGAGSYTRLLAADGVRTVGLDYSLPTVRKARRRSDQSIYWAVADVRRLPVRAAAVDGMLCLGVMQALSDPEPAARELMTAVRPGGTVWIDALNRRCLSTLVKRLLASLRRQPLNLRYDTPATLVRLLKAQGAESVRIHWVPILPAGLSRMQPLIETRAARSLLRRLPWLGQLLSHAFLISAVRGDREHNG